MTAGESESVTPVLKRDIGGGGSVVMTVNGVIGAGIFALPAIMAERAGLFSPWLVLIVGVLFFTIVAAMAELACYFRGTGGPVAYTRAAFGPFVAFQTGWLLYLSRVASTAANTNALILYLGFLLPGVTAGMPRLAAITLIIAALTALNYIGVKRAVNVMGVLTVLKITPLILLVVLGLTHVTWATVWPATMPEITDTGGTVLLLVYAFIGFESVLVPAGETRNPRRTIPLTLVRSIVAITLLYFLIQLVYVSVDMAPDNGAAPLVSVGAALAGPIGALVITLTAIFSLAGNLTNISVSGPRLTFALAEDGSLPSWFAHIHDRYGTPDRSILFQGAFSLVLALTGTFVWLAVISVLSRVVGYALSIAALPRVRKQAAAQGIKPVFRLPFGYAIPVAAIALCLWVAAQSTGEAWAMFAGLMAVGSALYLWARHDRAKVQT